MIELIRSISNNPIMYTISGLCVVYILKDIICDFFVKDKKEDLLDDEI